MRKILGTMLVLLLAALVGTGSGPAWAACSVPLFAYRHGTVTFAEGGHVARIHVEIADKSAQIEVGLMCRPSLDADAGMLFDFPYTTQSSFWMKNTLVPLAIAFIDSDWHIVRIMEMAVAPDPTADDASKFPLYNPQKPYRYALEVNTGYFTKHNLDDHADVRFIPEGSLSPRRGVPAEVAGGPGSAPRPSSMELTLSLW
ncbi:MAG TPA: DUF192 domain-containing protein [bacterium]|nr:DUF192 domain-containing protein [bacterium]